MARTLLKRRRKLPRDITKRTDAEVIALIFGKRVRQELDELTQDSAKRTSKNSQTPTKPS